MESLKQFDAHCHSFLRMHRRAILKSSAMALGGSICSPWTLLAERLARAEEKGERKVRSLIFLWLQGGPSQLETFDPHPNTKIGGETRSLDTSLKGVQISHLLPKSAEIIHHATLVRSMVSKEGDHERATYNMKTGWRPDPTLIHPSMGAVLCHQTSDNIEIPRHISILSSQWPSRGGYMGPQLDAFQVGDPKDPIQNLKSIVGENRAKNRLEDLQNIVEREFRRGRLKDLDTGRTLQSVSTIRARQMMESSQIEAFQVEKESKHVVDKFGDTPFGRGCLAAVRLIQQGVRCVEVELSGWDTHAKNHLLQSGRCSILDSALYGLITELESRELLDETIVVCGGEFGRTPSINVADGRDHWPTGFSTILFGGPFRRGYVHGETTHELIESGKDPLSGVKDPVTIEDLHATILSAYGIPFQDELQTPVGRPLALSKGSIVKSLLDV